MCHIFTLYMHSSIETAPLCKILGAIGPLFMDIWHLKDLGDTSVISECSLGVTLVIGNLFNIVSNTSPMCTISEQSDHYLWRYCILRIWGIQVSSANAVWVLI